RSHRLDGSELANIGSYGRVSNHADACNVGRDFLEQLKPFRTDAIFEIWKSGNVATRLRQTSNKAGGDWICHHYKYDWHRAGYLMQRGYRRSGGGKDDV